RDVAHARRRADARLRRRDRAGAEREDRPRPGGGRARRPALSRAVARVRAALRRRRALRLAARSLAGDADARGSAVTLTRAAPLGAFVNRAIRRSCVSL